MKKILFVTAAVFLGLSASAQNAGDAFDEFKRQRENQFSEYAEQRAREFEEFKARYYSAFEQFKQSYRKSLEDDVKVVDLMSSDDGIPIEPVKLAPAPPVAASTAAEQKQILRSSIRSIATMKPDDLLPELSSAEDTVERMKEAAQVMEAIAANLSADKQQDEAPLTPVYTAVVLEPYDPEFFSDSTQAEDAGVVEDVRTPVGSSPASVSDTSIPKGKPTDYVRISSPFGSRIHPITHKRHGHKGIDLAAPRNTPIYATADGVVTFSGRNGGYGNFVKLNHENGYKTAYAHMNSIAVRKGRTVQKGDLIGYVGSTGASTGNHLHYEVYYQDKLIDPATTL